MRYPKIDELIKQTEAVKKYPQVKKELEECMESNKNFFAQLEEQKRKVRELERKLGDPSELQFLNMRVETLEDQLKACGEKVNKSNEANETLQGQLGKLGRLKVSVEGKTLLEVEAAMIKAQDKEIETRVTDRLKIVTAKWEKEEKPKELRETAVRVIGEVIESLTKSGVALLNRDASAAKLPRLVTEYLESEVKRRMNDNIKKAIESEAHEISRAEVARLKTEEWPRFKLENIEPMVQSIISELKAGILRLLSEPLEMECTSCGTEWKNVFNSNNIDELSRKGETTVFCPNESCRSQLRMRLSQMIEAHLGMSGPPA